METTFCSVCVCVCYFLSSPHLNDASLILLISGACPQFTLSSPSMSAYSCPGSSITYTCALSSTMLSVTTIWKGSGFQCPQIPLYQNTGGILNPTAGGTCGNISAVTTNISNDGTCYTSVLTIPAVQSLNGTTIKCSDGITGTAVGNNTVNVKMIGGWSLMYIQYFFMHLYTSRCTDMQKKTYHWASAVRHIRFIF